MEAIILKKTPFSEGNEIITLYTRELGKVRAVARSVRSPKSKLSFALQTLYHTGIELVNGKRLATITGVKPIDTFKNALGDLKTIYTALYASEIILKSTADEQPNPELFERFVALLQHLNSSDTRHVCMHVFALEVLALTGYRIDLHNYTSCGKSLAEHAEVFFSSRRGGFVCEQCGQKTSDVSKISPGLYQFLSKQLFVDYNSMDMADVPESELQRFSQQFVTHILERNLNSGAYLDTL